MAFWKRKPGFALGDLQTYLIKRGKEQKILIFKAMHDCQGKTHHSHELDVDDLPILRALLDSVYADLKRR